MSLTSDSTKAGDRVAGKKKYKITRGKRPGRERDVLVSRQKQTERRGSLGRGGRQINRTVSCSRSVWGKRASVRGAGRERPSSLHGFHQPSKRHRAGRAPVAPAGWAASPAREQKLSPAFSRWFSSSGPATASPRAMPSHEHRSRCEAGSRGKGSERERRQGVSRSAPTKDGAIAGVGWRKAV